jgi:hypothetical protein
MSREFKLKYDELRDGDPTKTGSPSGSNGNNEYYSESHGHNICFVWLDGGRFFLNYSYLLSGELKVDDDKNIINLTFTSHTVVMQGYVLERLFVALMEHLPRVIYQVDERYALNDVDVAIVTLISVEKRED